MTLTRIGQSFDEENRDKTIWIQIFLATSKGQKVVLGANFSEI